MIKKTLTALLALVYFSANIVFAHSAEINLLAGKQASFWKDRKNTQVAALSTPAAPIRATPNDLIRQIPALGKALAQSSEKAVRPAGLALSGEIESVLDAVPSRAASIRDIYAAPNAREITLIVQDVHMNPEAQRNIVRVAEALRDRAAKMKTPLTMAVEGTSETFDFRAFESFPKKEIQRDVADAYLDQNLISAPSHLGMTSPAGAVTMTGIDDTEHYDANVRAYKEAMAVKEKRLADLENARRDLSERKRDQLNPALLKLDAVLESYRAGSLGFGAYLEALSRQENDELVVSQFLQAYRMEKQLNFSEVERQRAAVIRRLAEKLPGSRLRELISLSVSYRSGAVSYAGYYRAVRQMIAEAGIELASTPAFDEYIRYVFLSDGINAEKLLQAVKRMETSAVASLCRTGAEKSLMAESRYLALVDKLLNFALTPDEWTEYSSSSSHAVSQDPRSSDVKVDPGLRHSRMTDLASFEDFYREADARSERFVEKLAASPASVVVMGGFHTPRVTALLKARGGAYAVLQPKITKVDGVAGTEYLSIFNREKTPLEKLFEGQKLFLAPVALLIGRSGNRGIEQLAAENTLALAQPRETIGDAATLLSEKMPDGSVRHTTPDGATFNTTTDESTLNGKEPTARRAIKGKDVIFYGGFPWQAIVDLFKSIGAWGGRSFQKTPVAAPQRVLLDHALISQATADKLRADRPKDYITPTVLHLDSHQALVEMLANAPDSILTPKKKNFARMFIELHDVAYPFIPMRPMKGPKETDQDFATKLQKFKEQISSIETRYRERLIDIWTMAALAGDSVKADEPKKMQVEAKKLAEKTYKELMAAAQSEVPGVSITAGTNIGHGTTSMLIAIDRLTEIGFSETDARGIALLFAAHHPGYPITMVNIDRLQGVFSDDVLPVLFVTQAETDKDGRVRNLTPSQLPHDIRDAEISADGRTITHPKFKNDPQGLKKHIAEYRAHVLRVNIADYAAGMMNISKGEARELASLGFALDRITPARRMTDLKIEGVTFDKGVVVETDPDYWTGGETAKKYGLALPKTYEQLTIGEFFQCAREDYKKEPSAAIEAIDRMKEDLDDDGRDRLEALKKIARRQAEVVVDDTVRMENRVLDLIGERGPLSSIKIDGHAFHHHMEHIDKNILLLTHIVINGHSTIGPKHMEAVKYLLGMLIAIRTSPAMGRINVMRMRTEFYQNVVRAIANQAENGVSADQTQLTLLQETLDFLAANLATDFPFKEIPPGTELINVNDRENRNAYIYVRGGKLIVTPLVSTAEGLVPQEAHAFAATPGRFIGERKAADSKLERNANVRSAGTESAWVLEVAPASMRLLLKRPTFLKTFVELVTATMAEDQTFSGTGSVTMTIGTDPAAALDAQRIREELRKQIRSRISTMRKARIGRETLPTAEEAERIGEIINTYLESLENSFKDPEFNLAPEPGQDKADYLWEQIVNANGDNRNVMPLLIRYAGYFRKILDPIAESNFPNGALRPVAHNWGDFGLTDDKGEEFESIFRRLLLGVKEVLDAINPLTLFERFKAKALGQKSFEEKLDAARPKAAQGDLSGFDALWKAGAAARVFGRLDSRKATQLFFAYKKVWDRTPDESVKYKAAIAMRELLDDDSVKDAYNFLEDARVQDVRAGVLAADLHLLARALRAERAGLGAANLDKANSDTVEGVRSAIMILQSLIDRGLAHGRIYLTLGRIWDDIRVLADTVDQMADGDVRKKLGSMLNDLMSPDELGGIAWEKDLDSVKRLIPLMGLTAAERRRLQTRLVNGTTFSSRDAHLNIWNERGRVPREIQEKLVSNWTEVEAIFTPWQTAMGRSISAVVKERAEVRAFEVYEQGFMSNPSEYDPGIDAAIMLAADNNIKKAISLLDVVDNTIEAAGGLASRSLIIIQAEVKAQLLRATLYPSADFRHADALAAIDRAMRMIQDYHNNKENVPASFLDGLTRMRDLLRRFDAAKPGGLIDTTIKRMQAIIESKPPVRRTSKRNESVQQSLFHLQSFNNRSNPLVLVGNTNVGFGLEDLVLGDASVEFTQRLLKNNPLDATKKIRTAIEREVREYQIRMVEESENGKDKRKLEAYESMLIGWDILLKKLDTIEKRLSGRDVSTLNDLSFDKGQGNDDFELYNDFIDVLIRFVFGTQQLEGFHSYSHERFDRRVYAINSLLSVTDAKDSRTDPVADWLLGTGDCRHHAFVKQLLFDVKRVNELSAIIRQMYEESQRNEPSADKLQTLKKKFAAVSSRQMFVIDVTVVGQWQMEKFYKPLEVEGKLVISNKENGDHAFNLVEDHTMNLLIEFDPKNPETILAVRFADSFYQGEPGAPELYKHGPGEQREYKWGEGLIPGNYPLTQEQFLKMLGTPNFLTIDLSGEDGKPASIAGIVERLRPVLAMLAKVDEAAHKPFVGKLQTAVETNDYEILRESLDYLLGIPQLFADLSKTDERFAVSRKFEDADAGFVRLVSDAKKTIGKIGGLFDKKEEKLTPIDRQKLPWLNRAILDVLLYGLVQPRGKGLNGGAATVYEKGEDWTLARDGNQKLITHQAKMFLALTPYAGGDTRKIRDRKDAAQHGFQMRGFSMKAKEGEPLELLLAGSADREVFSDVMNEYGFIMKALANIDATLGTEKQTIKLQDDILLLARHLFNGPVPPAFLILVSDTLNQLKRTPAGRGRWQLYHALRERLPNLVEQFQLERLEIKRAKTAARPNPSNVKNFLIDMRATQQSLVADLVKDISASVDNDRNKLKDVSKEDLSAALRAVLERRLEKFSGRNKWGEDRTAGARAAIPALLEDFERARLLSKPLASPASQRDTAMLFVTIFHLLLAQDEADRPLSFVISNGIRHTLGVRNGVQKTLKAMKGFTDGDASMRNAYGYETESLTLLAAWLHDLGYSMLSDGMRIATEKAAAHGVKNFRASKKYHTLLGAELFKAPINGKSLRQMIAESFEHPLADQDMLDMMAEHEADKPGVASDDLLGTGIQKTVPAGVSFDPKIPSEKWLTAFVRLADHLDAASKERLFSHQKNPLALGLLMDFAEKEWPVAEARTQFRSLQATYIELSALYLHKVRGMAKKEALEKAIADFKIIDDSLSSANYAPLPRISGLITNYDVSVNGGKLSVNVELNGKDKALTVADRKFWLDAMRDVLQETKFGKAGVVDFSIKPAPVKPSSHGELSGNSFGSIRNLSALPELFAQHSDPAQAAMIEAIMEHVSRNPTSNLISTREKKAAGQVIFQQGRATSNDFIILLKGTLSIEQEDQGRAVRQIRSVGKGAIIGEMAILSGMRSATVRVESAEASYLRISPDGPDMAQLLSDPKFLLAYARLVASRRAADREAMARALTTFKTLQSGRYWLNERLGLGVSDDNIRRFYAPFREVGRFTRIAIALATFRWTRAAQLAAAFSDEHFARGALEDNAENRAVINAGILTILAWSFLIPTFAFFSLFILTDLSPFQAVFMSLPLFFPANVLVHMAVNIRNIRKGRPALTTSEDWHLYPLNKDSRDTEVIRFGPHTRVQINVTNGGEKEAVFITRGVADGEYEIRFPDGVQWLSPDRGNPDSRLLSAAEGKVNVGSVESDNNLVLAYRGVSRFHFQIELLNSGIVVHHMAGKNATKVVVWSPVRGSSAVVPNEETGTVASSALPDLSNYNPKTEKLRARQPSIVSSNNENESIAAGVRVFPGEQKYHETVFTAHRGIIGLASSRPEAGGRLASGLALGTFALVQNEVFGHEPKTSADLRFSVKRAAAYSHVSLRDHKSLQGLPGLAAKVVGFIPFYYSQFQYIQPFSYGSNHMLLFRQREDGFVYVNLLEKKESEPLGSYKGISTTEANVPAAVELKEGDVIVMYSDGVGKGVSDEDVADAVSKGRSDPRLIYDAIMEKVIFAKGGKGEIGLHVTVVDEKLGNYLPIKDEPVSAAVTPGVKSGILPPVLVQLKQRGVTRVIKENGFRPLPSDVELPDALVEFDREGNYIPTMGTSSLNLDISFNSSAGIVYVTDYSEGGSIEPGELNLASIPLGQATYQPDPNLTAAVTHWVGKLFWGWLAYFGASEKTIKTLNSFSVALPIEFVPFVLSLVSKRSLEWLVDQHIDGVTVLNTLANRRSIEKGVMRVNALWIGFMLPYVILGSTVFGHPLETVLYVAVVTHMALHLAENLRRWIADLPLLSAEKTKDSLTITIPLKAETTPMIHMGGSTRVNITVGVQAEGVPPVVVKLRRTTAYANNPGGPEEYRIELPQHRKWSGDPKRTLRPGDTVTVGRQGDQNMLAVIGDGVSRVHCEIIVVKGGFLVSDVGSSNGTAVQIVNPDMAGGQKGADAKMKRQADLRTIVAPKPPSLPSINGERQVSPDKTEEDKPLTIRPLFILGESLIGRIVSGLVLAPIIEIPLFVLAAISPRFKEKFIDWHFRANDPENTPENRKAIADGIDTVNLFAMYFALVVTADILFCFAADSLMGTRYLYENSVWVYARAYLIAHAFPHFASNLARLFAGLRLLSIASVVEGWVLDEQVVEGDIDLMLETGFEITGLKIDASTEVDIWPNLMDEIQVREKNGKVVVLNQGDEQELQAEVEFKIGADFNAGNSLVTLVPNVDAHHLTLLLKADGTLELKEHSKSGTRVIIRGPGANPATGGYKWNLKNSFQRPPYFQAFELSGVELARLPNDAFLAGQLDSVTVARAKRPKNQDRIFAGKVAKGEIVAVADGVSTANGDIAAETGIGTAALGFLSGFENYTLRTIGDLVRLAQNSLNSAHLAVRESKYIRNSIELEMGSTFVGFVPLTMNGEKNVLAMASGDSLLLLVRKNPNGRERVQVLTPGDGVYVGYKMRLPPTPAELAGYDDPARREHRHEKYRAEKAADPKIKVKSGIENALGHDAFSSLASQSLNPSSNPGFTIMPPVKVEEGDVLIMVTDGVYENVRFSEIEDIAMDPTTDADGKSKRLVELAREKGVAGKKDDIGLYVRVVDKNFGGEMALSDSYDVSPDVDAALPPVISVLQNTAFPGMRHKETGYEGGAAFDFAGEPVTFSMRSGVPVVSYKGTSKFLNAQYQEIDPNLDAAYDADSRIIFITDHTADADLRPTNATRITKGVVRGIYRPTTLTAVSTLRIGYGLGLNEWQTRLLFAPVFETSWFVAMLVFPPLYRQFFRAHLPRGDGAALPPEKMRWIANSMAFVYGMPLLIFYGFVIPYVITALPFSIDIFAALTKFSFYEPILRALALVISLNYAKHQLFNPYAYWRGMPTLTAGLFGHENVFSYDISPMSGQFAVVLEDRPNMVQFKTKSGEEAGRAPYIVSGRVRRVAFNSNGTVLAVLFYEASSDKNILRFFDFRQNLRLGSDIVGLGKAVEIRFIPRTNLLLVSEFAPVSVGPKTDELRVSGMIFDAAKNGQPVTSPPVLAQARLIFTSARGDLAVARAIGEGGQRSAVYFVDPRTLRETSAPIEIGDAHEAHFSPDGLFICAHDFDGVKIYDKKERTLSNVFDTRGGAINRGVEYSRDGKYVAGSFTSEQGPRVWVADALADSEPVVNSQAFPGNILDVKFSPRGNALAVLYNHGSYRRVIFLDPLSGETLGPPVRGSKNISSIRFSPDGDRLIGRVPDQALASFNVPTRGDRLATNYTFPLVYQTQPFSFKALIFEMGFFIRLWFAILTAQSDLADEMVMEFADAHPFAPFSKEWKKIEEGAYNVFLGMVILQALAASAAAIVLHNHGVSIWIILAIMPVVALAMLIPSAVISHLGINIYHWFRGWPLLTIMPDDYTILVNAALAHPGDDEVVLRWIDFLGEWNMDDAQRDQAVLDAFRLAVSRSSMVWDAIYASGFLNIAQRFESLNKVVISNKDQHVVSSTGSPSGDELAVVHYMGGLVEFISRKKGKETRNPLRVSGVAHQAAYSSDGNTLAVWYVADDLANEVIFFNLKTMEPIGGSFSELGDVTKIQFVPNDSRLLVFERQPYEDPDVVLEERVNVRILNPNSPLRNIYLNPHLSNLRFAGLSAQGELMTVQSVGQSLYSTMNFFNPRTMDRTRSSINMNQLFARDFQYSADGRYVDYLTGNFLHVYDLMYGTSVNFPTWRGTFFNRFVFSPDGKLLAAVTNDIRTHSITIIDAQTGKVEVEPSSTFPGYIVDVKYSPSGSVMAVLYRDGEEQRVVFFDPVTGKIFHNPVVGVNGATSIEFTADGQELFGSLSWYGFFRAPVPKIINKNAFVYGIQESLSELALDGDRAILVPDKNDEQVDGAVLSNTTPSSPAVRQRFSFVSPFREFRRLSEIAWEIVTGEWTYAEVLIDVFVVDHFGHGGITWTAQNYQSLRRGVFEILATTFIFQIAAAAGTAGIMAHYNFLVQGIVINSMVVLCCAFWPAQISAHYLVNFVRWLRALPLLTIPSESPNFVGGTHDAQAHKDPDETSLFVEAARKFFGDPAHRGEIVSDPEYVARGDLGTVYKVDVKINGEVRTVAVKGALSKNSESRFDFLNTMALQRDVDVFEAVYKGAETFDSGLANVRFPRYYGKQMSGDGLDTHFIFMEFISGKSLKKEEIPQDVGSQSALAVKLVDILSFFRKNGFVLWDGNPNFILEGNTVIPVDMGGYVGLAENPNGFGVATLVARIMYGNIDTAPSAVLKTILQRSEQRADWQATANDTTKLKEFRSLLLKRELVTAVEGKQLQQLAEILSPAGVSLDLGHAANNRAREALVGELRGDAGLSPESLSAVLPALIQLEKTEDAVVDLEQVEKPAADDETGTVVSVRAVGAKTESDVRAQVSMALKFVNGDPSRGKVVLVLEPAAYDAWATNEHEPSGVYFAKNDESLQFSQAMLNDKFGVAKIGSISVSVSRKTSLSEQTRKSLRILVDRYRVPIAVFLLIDELTRQALPISSLEELSDYAGMQRIFSSQA